MFIGLVKLLIDFDIIDMSNITLRNNNALHIYNKLPISIENIINKEVDIESELIVNDVGIKIRIEAENGAKKVRIGADTGKKMEQKRLQLRLYKKLKL